jgi:hypothetical protein
MSRLARILFTFAVNFERTICPDGFFSPAGRVAYAASASGMSLRPESDRRNDLHFRFKQVFFSVIVAGSITDRYPFFDLTD